MRITFESKGDFDNTIKWLNKVANNAPLASLEEIANSGVKSLSSNTPKDTGETAAGWKSKVSRKPNGAEIEWSNNSHPELDVNLAILIDKGHGTRTGGYVPPRPFIKNSMESVWSTAGDKIVKELIK